MEKERGRGSSHDVVMMVVRITISYVMLYCREGIDGFALYYVVQHLWNIIMIVQLRQITYAWSMN